MMLTPESDRISSRKGLKCETQLNLLSTELESEKKILEKEDVRLTFSVSLPKGNFTCPPLDRHLTDRHSRR